MKRSWTKDLHAKLIGSSATIERRVGGKFNVWDGYATGENLELIEDLSKVYEIGPKIADSVHHYFHLKENRDMMERLKKAGVNMKAVAVDKSKLPLSGKSFVITGSLSRPRPDVEDEIKSLGGEIHSSVSKKTDYLLVGSEPGSKYLKAKELGVNIINEKEYKNIKA